MKAIDKIIKYNPCKEAVIWLDNKSVNEMIDQCPRGDWLLWLAKKVGIEKRPLTLAKGLCAKTVIHLIKDERSKKAVEIAIKYGNGEATDEDLDVYASAAYAAATYAATAYAYAAYAAAYAYAAHAADASAADADAANASAAQIKNQKETADICRRVFGNELKQILK